MPSSLPSEPEFAGPDINLAVTADSTPPVGCW